MSVSISALGQLTPSQPLSLSDYPSSSAPQTEKKAAFVTPPAGEYILTMQPSFSSDSFSKSQKGALMLSFDAVIAGPAFEGTTVRFQRVSAQPFPRKGADGVERQASFMGDLAKAAGLQGELPGVTDDGDAQPQADFIVQTAGRNFRAKINWVAKDRKFGTGLEVKGMTNFPRREDGTYQPYIELEGKTNDRGYPARVWANLEITGYVTD